MLICEGAHACAADGEMKAPRPGSSPEQGKESAPGSRAAEVFSRTLMERLLMLRPPPHIKASSLSAGSFKA